MSLFICKEGYFPKIDRSIMTIEKSSPVICVYIAIVAVTSQSDNKMRCICTGMKQPSLVAEGELATSCFCKYELTHNSDTMPLLVMNGRYNSSQHHPLPVSPAATTIRLFSISTSVFSHRFALNFLKFDSSGIA